jgi:hypothetical protein
VPGVAVARVGDGFNSLKHLLSSLI